MTGHESTMRAHAQRNAVAAREALGMRVSARVFAGAVLDAGGLDGYATAADYELALGDFIAARQRHARLRLPAPSAARSAA